MSTAITPTDAADMQSLLKALATLALRSKWTWAAAIVGCGLFFGWQNSWFGLAAEASSSEFLTYRVQPRDLPITIIERGNLESQSNLQVFCEVDDVRSDGVHGTPIVWLIPNGSSVSKGDLICELDSSAIQSELDEQILDTEEARSSFIQAEANVENQAIVNSTAEDKARLDVALAKLDLEMFEHEEMGSHKLAVEAIERQIDDINNDILAAEMSLKLRRDEKTGIESLFKLGYAGKSEMDRSVLSYLQAEGDYAAALNKLQTQLASKEKLDSFDKRKQQMELEGRQTTAMQNLEQVIVTNRARMAQVKGLLTSRTEQLKKEEERLARYQSMLEKCQIHAPQDGMVAYAAPSSSRDPEIAEGIPVRPRQHILSIPNLRSMQVETSVHESVLDRIQTGMKVAVKVDAFPDRGYSGTVTSVAVLPERSYYSESKTYETVITIDEDVYQLKPGMTAVCEVNVDYLPEVNAVPIQAVVQRAGNNWIYVQDKGDIEKRSVSVGASNDQFVVITDGINTGDLVVLNPGSIHEESTEQEQTQPEAEAPASEAASLVSKTPDKQQPAAIN